MIEPVWRGIGSEFGLSPTLLKPSSAPNRIPVRNGCAVWLNSGRAAIKWAWEALRQRDLNRLTCLLPGYLCPAVVQPFRETEARLVFYRVDNHLQVDVDDLRSRLGPDALAVVIIHYFGFPQPEAVFDLLQRTDPPVYVIEDVTHAWLSRSNNDGPVGQRGTISIYSPRKFFPVPDGAMAVLGDGDIHPNMKVAPTDWHFTLQRTAGLFLRYVFAKTGIEAVNRRAFSLLHRAERALDEMVTISQGSWISRRVLLNLDFAAVVERRRQNYEFLLKGIQERQLPLQPLYGKLPAGVTPLGFPVVCERRDDLREFLIERRVYPPIHWLLPKEQGVVKFQHLADLSEHILTLPVDQRYDLEDMAYVLTCLAEWSNRCDCTR